MQRVPRLRDGPSNGPSVDVQRPDGVTVLHAAPDAPRRFPAGPEVRKAIILAAGTGQRLRPLTDNLPKCLVEVEGEPILFRTLNTLAQYGIREVVIVVGHCADQVIEAVGHNFKGIDIKFVRAPQYDTTNNIVSLWEARQHCDEDLLLIEGDVIFEGEALRRLLAYDGNAMAVAPHRSWFSGTVIRQSADGKVTSMILGADQGTSFDYTDVFKTVNIYRLDGRFLREHYVPALSAEIARGNVDVYYESVLKDLIATGAAEFQAVDVGDRLWYEVDDYDDLETAGYIFASPAERFERVQRLHGGYWRYGFKDHSYLYNLYFPPDEMLSQFHQDLRNIVTNYPVGQAELMRLVANWTAAPVEQHAVANGASELIKILGCDHTARLTIPVPSFNEYESVVAPANLNRFYLDQTSFDLDVEAFAAAAIRARSSAAVVVTPNNPTSLSVPRAALLYLAEQLRAHDCLLVVDESFIEFSGAGAESGLQPALDANPNLVIVKSMSKVFGIAGLRLGYLLSANTALVESVRRKLPIWNVNGLGEAFLRSLGRFRRQFEASCDRVKADRDDLYEMLLTVPGIQPFKPDANFVFCRIEHPALTGPDLVKRLFFEHNTLTKDCAGKSMQEGDRYIRIASRTPEENRQLVEALRRLD